MSLNNIEVVGYNALNNLSSINADEVNTGILTKSDPDITDLQFDQLFDINTNQTIQQQINGVSGSISTFQTQINDISANVIILQGQMTTANTNISTLNGEVNTLQSEMNTAQSDINDLQSDVNTAQADIIALYSTTATNTGAIVGLVASQIAQDSTIAGQSIAIGGLQTQMTTANTNITALQVKTQDMNWSALSGTDFDRTIRVGNSGFGGAYSAVFSSNSGTDNMLLRKLVVPQIIASGGTSSFDSITTTNNLEANQNLVIAGNSFFGSTNRTQKKLVLFDNNVGFVNSDINSSTIYTTIDGAKNNICYGLDVNAGSHIFTYANTTATRKNILEVNGVQTISSTPHFTILKSQLGGETQNLHFESTPALGLTTMDWKTASTGTQAYDAQIFTYAGADGVLNDGNINIYSGDVNLKAVKRKIVNLAQTGIDSTATTGNINTTATAGAINSTANTNMNITATNGDVNIISSNGDVKIDTSGILKTISIGNSTSIVNIYGIINMPNGTNFNMLNSFFSQF